MQLPKQQAPRNISHERLPRGHGAIFLLSPLHLMPGNSDCPTSKLAGAAFGHSSRPAQSSFRSPSRRILFLSLLVLLIALTLATPRAVPRILLLGTHLRAFSSPVAARLAQYPIFARYSSTFRPASNIPQHIMDAYKKPPQAPPTFIGTKENIVSDTKALCEKTRAVLDKLVADISPTDADKTTFENVLLPQVYDENQSGLTSRILGFYQYVSSDAALRNASTEAETILDEFCRSFLN